MSASRVRSGRPAPPLGTWRGGVPGLCSPPVSVLHEMSPAGTGTGRRQHEEPETGQVGRTCSELLPLLLWVFI